MLVSLLVKETVLRIVILCVLYLQYALDAVGRHRPQIYFMVCIMSVQIILHLYTLWQQETPKAAVPTKGVFEMNSDHTFNEARRMQMLKTQ